ncbi:MAG: hypothetical protein ACRCVU_17855 [Flavobacterium sp.]
MTHSDLLLSMIPAFLGAIAPKNAGISYDYTEDTITIYGYLDSIPTDEDYETIDIVITEIMASLPNILFQKIVLTNTTALVSELKHYKGWFYIRKE